MAITKVLITVTTYPLPSRSYDELVCTAGILEDGSWIRIYPVPFKFLLKSSTHKYSWIELNLKRRESDFRPESHSPVHTDLSDLKIIEELNTKNGWAERKKHCLKNVFYDMNKLIERSKEPNYMSLATFKPTEIVDFIAEPTDREWKRAWLESLKQLELFSDPKQPAKMRIPIDKIPYKFKYVLKDETGKKRTMMIEDWEIGALYRNCLKRANNNEKIAVQKVREKYFDDFAKKKDLYLFLGTTKQWHQRKAKNPFVIIGVFYPPKVSQLSLNFDF